VAKRALLIGSQTGGLTGVHGDVEVLDDALTALGFDTNPIIEEAVTYAGIVASYRALIEDSTEGDAAVVYYSGHGGRSANTEAASDPNLPAWLQYLVPWDIDDRSDGGFRGLLAEEVSMLQWELTQKTTNVTTILDCCHSARMSRDPAMIPKADDRITVPWPTVGERWAALRRDLDTAGVTTDANPHAVQVVACSPDQSAYELSETIIGGAHGALTANLVAVLRTPQAATLTWREIMDVIRPAVLDIVPMQRPDILGPNADRFLFSLEERSASGVLPVKVDGGVALLEGAALFGVAEGDRFAIVAAGGDPRQPMATAIVERLVEGRARLQLSGADPGDLETGTTAHPIEVALGRRPVAVVPADHPERQEIVDALRSSPHARVVDRTADVMATVRLGDDGMTLLDGGGEPLHETARAMTPGSLTLLSNDLRTLARATHVRELASGRGPAELPDEVGITWARLTPAGDVGLAPSGEHLFVGDRLVVRAANRSAETRYLSVLDVGISGAVSLQTTSEPDGITLAPGESYTVGTNVVGEVEGLTLFWPDGVPAGGPRPETFVLVVADRKVDGLARLAQAGVKKRAAGEGPPTTLDAIIDEIDSGRRDSRPAQQAPAPTRYRVLPLDFVFHPVGRGGDDTEPEFEMDERPDPSFRLVVPRAAAAPSRVAVRLKELTVHSNRAILKAAVRIDALVITAPPEGSGSPYLAATTRFDRIADGDSLPFENLLLFEGPVGRFLDIAIWVAKDDQRELDLSELLAKEAGSDEVKGAVAVLVGLAIAAPPAAVVAASVAAVATIVRTGARLLNKAVGQGIGVYRTSLLPHENFGAGRPAARHPAEGVIKAQDMSFAYEVVDPDAV
jgi:Caspase domain